MRLSLQCHPDTPGPAVKSVSALPRLATDNLFELIFRIEGDFAGIVWPERRGQQRADELWQSTCFEMFVESGDGPAYLEFNFSPSSQWAAYEFDRYREGMRLFNLPHPPNIEAQKAIDSNVWEVGVSLDGSAWTGGVRCGFSAVVEEKDGRKSYWALAHPPGKPDFHHRDCFVHKLRAT